MSQVTGEKIRRLRLEAGLSMEKLADLSGLSMTAVWSVEHGSHKPREKTMRQLMDVLCQSRSKTDELAIRCRWCGQSIIGLTWDPFRKEVVVDAPPLKFSVKRGYFYHVHCLDEKTRTDESFPD
jgi:transcriptional regulator with XRE-family HTH domain